MSNMSSHFPKRTITSSFDLIEEIKKIQWLLPTKTFLFFSDYKLMSKKREIEKKNQIRKERNYVSVHILDAVSRSLLSEVRICIKF